MSGSDGLTRNQRLWDENAHSPHLLLLVRLVELPRNLILCCLQGDQWQSQSPKASVWNEKYVRLRSKRKMSERKIGRQIECAPMCLTPTKLHGCCMTWATLATQWVDLRANYIQPLYHFPSWSLASVSLGAEGPADHIICYPAWAELPVKKEFSAERLWRVMSQLSPTSRTKKSFHSKSITQV